MDLSQNSKNDDDECIVYLETYYFDKGKLYAFIDFRLQRDLELFLKFFAKETNINIKNATFIELVNLKTSKQLIRGKYYKLNLELLKNKPFEEVTDSLILGGRFNLEGMQKPISDESEMLQKHKPFNPEKLSVDKIPHGKVFNLERMNNLELFVKDVGQANWNELRSGENVIVLFDAGAELRSSKSKTTKIFGRRENDLKRSKPVLIISHWDLDHIHCLKLLDIQGIKDCFSKIVCPDNPKSITSKSIREDFITALGTDNVYSIPPPPRTVGGVMHLWRKEGCISIYHAENSSSINLCGLLMFVKGENSSANFTGDCRLSQAMDAYVQEMEKGIITNQHVLIAPHHGGDYGTKYRIYPCPCDEIIISVGANNKYGHPHYGMLNYLQKLGNVELTNQKNRTNIIHRDIKKKL